MNERGEYCKDFLLTHVPTEWITEVLQDILSKLSKPIILNTLTFPVEQYAN